MISCIATLAVGLMQPLDGSQVFVFSRRLDESVHAVRLQRRKLMYSKKKHSLACVVMAVMLCALGNTSCADPAHGSNANDSVDSINKPAPVSASKTLAQMLEDVSTGVGEVPTTKEGSSERRVCLIEERHTSVAGQIEIALMLLRLHDRYGLRDIALEGLTKDKEFPFTAWFRAMGGPEDEDLRNQIAVGLLRQGEISAVELIALVFPDVIVHAADDTTAYAVEMTKKAGTASAAYLYKIAFKSVRREHYSQIQQLNEQKKFRELIDYVISLDSWAKDRYEQLKNAQAVNSTEQMLRNLQDIENRAKSVGAETSEDDRRSMVEAKAFFEAAIGRSTTMVQTALGVASNVPLVALNIGAAHTEGIKRMLDEAKTTYGVLTPLSLARNLKAGDLSYEAFERKYKYLSVAWTRKGLGSLLDGRKKAPPIVGMKRTQAESQLRYATAIMARQAGNSNFPDKDIRKKLDGLDYVRVKWPTVRKDKGDVIFLASVLGEKGSIEIWARCGVTPGMEAFGKRKGPTLEKLLLDGLEKVRKEPGERIEPKEGPVVEMVTPDVSAAYDTDEAAVVAIRKIS